MPIQLEDAIDQIRALSPCNRRIWQKLEQYVMSSMPLPHFSSSHSEAETSGLPIRIRPVILGFTATVLALLGLLGYASD